MTRVRIETNTTDGVQAAMFAADENPLGLPQYVESETRLLDLPLFAMMWGGRDSHQPRRTICTWLAIGPIAVSSFLAFGGLAIAPIAMGGITVGVLSLSLSWGIGVGVLTVGSVAVGWSAFGCAAAAVGSAAGLVVVARDYAVGLVASGAETGAPAMEWLTYQWFTEFTETMLRQMHWWILSSVMTVLDLRIWRSRPGSTGKFTG